MNQDQILEVFKESGALLNGHFRLTSGRHSDVYYEKFTLLKNPAICTRICEEMAARFKSLDAVTVIGPTLGGVIIGYEVARYLGIQALYAEAGDNDDRVLKRGFVLESGEQVLIVDDILTTGRSLKEIIALVNSYKAKIVGIGVLLDRSGGKADIGLHYDALATVAANSWIEDDCPMCADGKPITQRGSRELKKSLTIIRFLWPCFQR